jgi:hypothetical protein
MVALARARCETNFMRHSLAYSMVTTITAGLLIYGCGSSDDPNAGPVDNGKGGSSAAGGADAGQSDTSSGGTAGTHQGGNAGAQTGGSSGAQTGGSAGSQAGSSGAQVDAAVDADFTYDAPVFEASLQDACVDETAKAEPFPLDIYFLLDASTSMSSPAGSGATGDCDATPPFTPSKNSKWCKAVNAIGGYVSSAEATGNRAAIQYFKHYTNHNCDGTGYDTPAVPLGILTGVYGGQAQTLVEQNPGGLNWAYPYSNTPTEGALRGLAKFTAANQTAGRIIIGILVTDGTPTACDTSDSTLAGIAQAHFTATGIHTFMVGMTGASFTKLETWASYTGSLLHDDTNNACGTCDSCTCHHYNVGDGAPAVFIAALQSIQKSVLSCTFQVPQPSQGVLNPDLVKVEYSPGGQPPVQELPRVDSAAQCTGAGWYYEFDANNNPTKIILCPSSCTTVQADTNAAVKIRIACQGS